MGGLHVAKVKMVAAIAISLKRSALMMLVCGQINAQHYALMLVVVIVLVTMVPVPVLLLNPTSDDGSSSGSGSDSDDVVYGCYGVARCKGKDGCCDCDVIEEKCTDGGTWSDGCAPICLDGSVDAVTGCYGAPR